MLDLAYSMSMSAALLLTHMSMSVLMSTIDQSPHKASSQAAGSSCSPPLPRTLGIVALLDSLDGRLELGLVGAHHDEDAQVERVHVRVGEQALR